MRVSLLSYKMPELKGTQQGVFSKIPRHESTDDKRYFDTCYKDSYNKKEFNGNLIDTKTFNDNNVFAGNESNSKQVEKIKITTKLISEKYNSKIANLILLAEVDAKFNTSIQRTWINKKDSAVMAVEELNIDNTKEIVLPPRDNELSVNIACIIYKLILNL